MDFVLLRFLFRHLLMGMAIMLCPQLVYAQHENIQSYFPHGVYPRLESSDPASEKDPGLAREIKGLRGDIQRSVQRVAQRHNTHCAGDPCLLQVFPLIYNKRDSGFFGGLQINLTNIREQDPYTYSLNASVVRSDTREWLSQSQLDIPQFKMPFLSLKTRLRLRGRFSRSTEFRYVGQGLNSHHNLDLADQNLRYSLEELSTGGTLLFPIEIHSSMRFGVFASFDWSHINTDPFGSSTLLYQEQPRAFEGGTYRSVAVGYYRDSRDNEFLPTEGEFFEVSIGSGFIQDTGDFSYRSTVIDRRYWSQGSWTLAHRLSLDALMGYPPFWELRTLGGIDPISDVSGSGILKGYFAGRFHEPFKAIESLELRMQRPSIKAFGQGADWNWIPVSVDFGLMNQYFVNSISTGVAFLWNRSFLTRLWLNYAEENLSMKLYFRQEF